MTEKIFGFTLPSLSDEDKTPRGQSLLKYEEYKSEYEKSMTMGWPVLLVIFGIFLFFVNGVIGLVLFLAGLIWAGVRFASRGHLYQRMKDAERDLKEIESKGAGD